MFNQTIFPVVYAMNIDLIIPDTSIFCYDKVNKK